MAFRSGALTNGCGKDGGGFFPSLAGWLTSFVNTSKRGAANERVLSAGFKVHFSKILTLFCATLLSDGVSLI